MYLSVKVQAKSPRTEFIKKLVDGEGNIIYKFRLKAAPERGRANAELIAFLAQACQVKADKVRIVSGASQPHKLLKLPDNTQLPW